MLFMVICISQSCLRTIAYQENEIVFRSSNQSSLRLGLNRAIGLDSQKKLLLKDSQIHSWKFPHQCHTGTQRRRSRPVTVFTSQFRSEITTLIITLISFEINCILDFVYSVVKDENVITVVKLHFLCCFILHKESYFIFVQSRFKATSTFAQFFFYTQSILQY